MPVSLRNNVSYVEIREVIDLSQTNLTPEARNFLSKKLRYFRENHKDTFQRALSDSNFEEDSKEITQNLEKGSLSQQKDALRTLLRRAIDYKEIAAGDYLLKTAIPYIKKNGITALAGEVLSYTANKSNEPAFTVFKALGTEIDKRNIIEFRPKPKSNPFN